MILKIKKSIESNIWSYFDKIKNIEVSIPENYVLVECYDDKSNKLGYLGVKKLIDEVKSDSEYSNKCQRRIDDSDILSIDEFMLDVKDLDKKGIVEFGMLVKKGNLDKNDEEKCRKLHAEDVLKDTITVDKDHYSILEILVSYYKVKLLYITDEKGNKKTIACGGLNNEVYLLNDEGKTIERL